MKYLVLADIHINLEAFKAVLADAEKSGFHRLLVLGDIVGYYTNPNQIVSALRRDKDAFVLMGNHDAGATGLIGLEDFNEGARKCLEWTKSKLTPENHAYLKELPKFFSNDFLLACHGSPRDNLWEYMDSKVAKISLEMISERLLLVGHTHECFVFRKGDTVARFIPKDETIDFANKRTVVSLPSVGQPRDGNPEAGYAVLDFDNQLLKIKRVPYIFQETQAKLRQQALPDWEAERLEIGR